MIEPIEYVFHVELEEQLCEGNLVCVTGSCNELGNWKPNLIYFLEHNSERRQAWTGRVSVRSNCPVHYRYCRVRKLQEEYVVIDWESHKLPRLANTNKIEKYGWQGDLYLIESGWLTSQIEVRLCLMNSPVVLWNECGGRTYIIKCSSKCGESANSSMECYVSVLNGANNTVRSQPCKGTPMDDDTYIVFSSQTCNKKHTFYQLNIYSTDQSYLGTASVLADSLWRTAGVRTIPIISAAMEVIGKIRVEYLIIKPARNVEFTMEQTFSHCWSRKKGPVFVGHKGMGSSLGTGRSHRRENTIMSFNEAGMNGADFVEFDVHLTKDKIPVVYHDFTLRLAHRSLDSSNYENDLIKFPVCYLSFADLNHIKLKHSDTAESLHPEKTEQVSPEEWPFPTLRECFEKTEAQIGFMIELKVPLKLEDGSLEDDLHQFIDESWIDTNVYLDTVLQVCQQFAANRRLVFACFSPNVCTMLRLKQNRWPIVYTCLGKTNQWPPYKDLRTKTFDMGINYCVSEKLMGIAFHSEELATRLELVQDVRNKGMVVFCWGEKTNDIEFIRKMKSSGIDGALLDQISNFTDLKVNLFKS